MKIHKINKNFALLYGILLGDGCISSSSSKYFISVVGNIYDDIHFYEKIVIPLFNGFRDKNTVYRKRPKYGKIEINFSDKDLFQYIRSVGFPVGKKGTKLLIPNKLRKYTKEVIAGLFATDGSLVLTDNNGILYPRIEIRSLSRKMLEQTRDFLNMNGLNGYVYKVKEKSIMYRLQFNGRKNLFKFRKKIGFINPKHEDKFNRYIKLEKTPM